MNNYENVEGKKAPWNPKAGEIDLIEISGVTNIGNYAFYGCNNYKLDNKNSKR